MSSISYLPNYENIIEEFDALVQGQELWEKYIEDSYGIVLVKHELYEGIKIEPMSPLAATRNKEEDLEIKDMPLPDLSCVTGCFYAMCSRENIDVVMSENKETFSKCPIFNFGEEVKRIFNYELF